LHDGDYSSAAIVATQYSTRAIYFLCVTPKLSPEFTRKNLLVAVEEFGRRQHGYGVVQ
jgi:hypothetical protein